MPSNCVVLKVSWKRKIYGSSTNAEKAKEFWGSLSYNPVPYKEVAEWLKELELALVNVNIQDNVEMNKEDATMQLKKMKNWKVPELDGTQGFSLKRFTSQR